MTDQELEVIEPEDGRSLVLLGTGEIISLDDPAEVATGIAHLREISNLAKDGLRILTAAVVEQAERMGKKTIQAGGSKLELRGGSEVEWDLEVLEELHDAGLPDERFGDLVKTEISYKVDAAVARQIEGANARYAEIIGRARRRVEKPYYVSVK